MPLKVWFLAFILALYALGDEPARSHVPDASEEPERSESSDPPDAGAREREEQTKMVEAVDQLLKTGEEVKANDGSPTVLGNYIRVQENAFLFIDEPAKQDIAAAIAKVRSATTEVERGQALRSATERIRTGVSSDFAMVVYNAEKGGWFASDLTGSLKGGASGIMKAIQNPQSVADIPMPEGKAARITSGTKETGALYLQGTGGTGIARFEPLDTGKTLRLTFDKTKKKLVQSWE